MIKKIRLLLKVLRNSSSAKKPKRLRKKSLLPDLRARTRKKQKLKRKRRNPRSKMRRKVTKRRKSLILKVTMTP